MLSDISSRLVAGEDQSTSNAFWKDARFPSSGISLTSLMNNFSETYWLHRITAGHGSSNLQYHFIRRKKKHIIPFLQTLINENYKCLKHYLQNDLNLVMLLLLELLKQVLYIVT